MAGLIGNLVYRISVSAIVGAVVAGGVIYLNNQQVVSAYQSSLTAHVEKQDKANEALMNANADLASAIAALEVENTRRVAELNDQLTALGNKIDAIPVAQPADYTIIIDSIAAMNANISAQIADLSAQTQEP